MRPTLLTVVVAGLLSWCATAQAADAYFGIQVVDEATGRGVPLVELTTTHNVRYYTDSQGWAAIHEPGLMGGETYFAVRSHGYEYPKDGFGFRGARLKLTPGGRATVKVKRLNIAERLYRVTGEGIYRDSVLLGHKAPIRQPLLNGRVMGQDSVQRILYHGKIHWFWGDTNLPNYPLGNFHMSGATSDLPGRGGLDPSAGIDLTYFTGKDGAARAMVAVETIPGPGPIWLSGFALVRDDQGQERLVADYARVKGLEAVLERGMAAYNDRTDKFERLVRFDNPDELLHLTGHPVRVERDGKTYLYGGFGPPFCLRVEADWKKIQTPAACEGYTPLAAGTRFDGRQTRLQRTADGKLVIGWKANTPALSEPQQAQLVRAGLLREGEIEPAFRDAATGKSVRPHGGSVCWNEYRKRYVAIFVETGGSSFLGEVWYSEADTPEGPWLPARKIVTHDRYTFYNPAHHPLLDQEGGRVIYFEGTYASTFSGNPEQTPRYDYNQIMYRLDLSDPRLAK